MRRPAAGLVVALALTLASAAVAGWLGEWRDGDADTVSRVGIGEDVRFAPGQTLSVVSVRGGQLVGGGSSVLSTPGRFVVVTVRSTTAGARAVPAVRCSAVTADGVFRAVDGGVVGFPDPGEARTSEVVLDVAEADLDGLQLTCSEQAVVSVTQPKAVFDLALDEVPDFWARTGGVRLDVASPLVEALP